MQDELGATFARLSHLLVEPLGFPARENPRLLLRKAGLHGEIGLRQEDRVSVVALLAHKSARLSGGGALAQFVRSPSATSSPAALPPAHNPRPSAPAAPRLCRTLPRAAGSDAAPPRSRARTGPPRNRRNRARAAPSAARTSAARRDSPRLSAPARSRAPVRSPRRFRSAAAGNAPCRC